MAVLVLVFHLLILPAAAGATRSGCPGSCGYIPIQYPFGTAPGCYRPGFQLTCIHNTTLLLVGSDGTSFQVSNFDNHELTVNASFSVSTVDGSTHNVAWASALAGTPYTISNYNSIYAAGCGIVGSVVDSDTGETVAACLSLCNRTAIDSYDDDDCYGIVCCSAPVDSRGTRSFGIRLDRLDAGVAEPQTPSIALLTSDSLSMEDMEAISSRPTGF